MPPAYGYSNTKSEPGSAAPARHRNRTHLRKCLRSTSPDGALQRNGFEPTFARQPLLAVRLSARVVSCRVASVRTRSAS